MSPRPAKPDPDNAGVGSKKSNATPSQAREFFLKRALIFVNGELHNVNRLKTFLRADDFFIAVDGGHRHLRTLGLLPHLVIGDLDSLPDDERQELISAGVEMKIFPSEKNETDLELSLLEAVYRRFKSILVVAALGGRLDQTLANISLLAAPFLKDCDVQMEDGCTHIWLMTAVRDPATLEIHGLPGDRISLLAFHEAVIDIFTQGLKYPLNHEDLLPHQTRGISNLLMETSALIQISQGRLLILHSNKEK